MPTLSLLSVLIIVWAAVTVVFLSLVAYRSLVGLKEEDTLILSAGESKIEAAQKEIHARLDHIQPYLRGFGWASAGLAAIAAAVWIYQSVKLFLS